MADPSGGIATACAAGLCAAFVAFVGVEPQALVWGLVGAVFGLSAAPSTGRLRAVFVFLGVTLACSLLGTWASNNWHGGSIIARNAWAMLSASAFHPAMAAFVSAAPRIVNAIVSARTGGQQ